MKIYWIDPICTSAWDGYQIFVFPPKWSVSQLFQFSCWSKFMSSPPEILRWPADVSFTVMNEFRGRWVLFSVRQWGIGGPAPNTLPHGGSWAVVKTSSKNLGQPSGYLASAILWRLWGFVVLRLCLPWPVILFTQPLPIIFYLYLYDKFSLGVRREPSSLLFANN